MTARLAAQAWNGGSEYAVRVMRHSDAGRLPRELRQDYAAVATFVVATFTRCLWLLRS